MERMKKELNSLREEKAKEIARIEKELDSLREDKAKEIEEIKKSRDLEVANLKVQLEAARKEIQDLPEASGHKRSRGEEDQEDGGGKKAKTREVNCHSCAFDLSVVFFDVYFLTSETFSGRQFGGSNTAKEHCVPCYHQ